MSIEEAEYILNEAVIIQPSISSYTYISAEEINTAINTLLESRYIEKEEIKELENNYIKEINRLNNIINEKDEEIEKYKNLSKEKRIVNFKFKNIIKYIKKIGKPLFLLEN